jgi:hypothetical protein
MAPNPVTVYPAAASKVALAGRAVTAVYAGAQGGFIVNPFMPEDQGLAQVETLFYDFTGPAAAVETATTFPLQPGQSLTLPANMTTNVTVNAVSAGHKFSAYVIQPSTGPAAPFPNATFPPAGPTSLTNTIPMYLYEQYRDDADLRAFVAAHNGLIQQYIDLFNQIELPVYTNPMIQGALLDWVAAGLYGMTRPVLFSGRNNFLGPYNTATLNTLAFNETKRVGASNVTVTNDDIFKRIMTWRLYRGDGKTFNVKWLKRRIVRFLNGPNGTAPVIDNTYNVSVSFAANRTINVVLPNVEFANFLQQAIQSGAVELPFQYSFNVTVSAA